MFMKPLPGKGLSFKERLIIPINNFLGSQAFAFTRVSIAMLLCA